MKKDKPNISSHKLYDKLLKEFHPTLNGGLKLSDFTHASTKIFWWKCYKGEDHEWEASLHSRTSGNNCPCCNGRKAVLSNCLVTTHPDVAKQWHPTKNKLTPFEITHQSNKKVWWKCDKADDHEYESIIFNKTRTLGRQLGCPICSGQKVISSNCLATTHPEIAKKWHPTKNLSLTPFDVTFGSGKKVWWKCNENHEWITSVDDLVGNINDGGNGCALCSSSNGENKIKNILDKMNITYEIQKTFDDCKNTKKLRFDFYLQKHNVLIEYDGMQHFKPIKFFGGIKRFNDLNKHDKIKNEYAIKNNIPLLRIPYTKFDSIEEEIKNFLEKIII